MRTVPELRLSYIGCGHPQQHLNPLGHAACPPIFTFQIDSHVPEMIVAQALLHTCGCSLAPVAFAHTSLIEFTRLMFKWSLSSINLSQSPSVSPSLFYYPAQPLEYSRHLMRIFELLIEYIILSHFLGFEIPHSVT